MRYLTRHLMQARSLELLALAMVGDGLLAMLQPRRHMRLWREGPPAWRALNDYFVERPGLTRVVGAAAVVAGLWLANRQTPR